MDNIKNANRNSALDLLKGICILFVIITHLDWSDSARLKLAFPFWISMAVPIFLIITGYLYSLSFEKRNINSFEVSYSLNNVVPKFIRYTFPFLIIFFVEYVYLRIENGSNKNFIKLFFGFLRGGYGSGSYYYPLLLQFLILFPIIYFIIKKFLAKGCFFFLLLNIFYEIIKYNIGLSYNSYRILIFRFLFVIAFGCYVGIKKIDIKKPVVFVLSIVGIIYIIIALYLQKGPNFINFKIYVSVFNVLYVLPVVFLFNKRLKFKPLEIIGKASYNILWVQSLYYLVLKNSLVSFFELNILLKIFISITICCSLGIAFYYIEKPITDFIIKKANKLITHNF